MRQAVLDGARCLVVAFVTVHYQNPREAFGAKDLPGHAARTALTKTEETDQRGTKQPGVTVQAVIAPPGFIGVLDRSASILQEQALRHFLQAASQLVKRRPQGALAHTHLSTQMAQGNAVEV